ncbi:hypothetical protein L21SP5_03786 [Salinivirga cyanobacteriivorans]|uniref:Uncharacterized protein n=1 Tax=Salinivirga cyanobacteriivorans TaxID=1307839 RepID=A0A0S2I5D7_9BACT|nr:hypothetical protein [Salinivirga cyanobacteriivorans]ALO17381.1 hypothetical protein L21SP5_03786 [Salinivirga cyanobacteriivorans]
MDISHEDFQRAKRISRAIQEYLELTNQDGLRSTDIYPVLAKKGLIEKDRHNGLHFRKFLRKLKDNNLLKSLIPQCEYRHTKTEFLEWYFYRSIVKTSDEINSTTERKKLIVPETAEEEINELIEKAKKHIAKLPKRDTSEFTPQMNEIRNNYPRAYEIWTEREIEIMIRAYNKFKRIDKVAELLQRQPSVVKERIDNNK